MTKSSPRGHWRMQLHPNDAENAVQHSVKCLSAGLIGLDFGIDQDMLTLDRADLRDDQRDAWPFAHEMATGDVVLIMAHHFPLAICRVAGEYNYLRVRDGGLGGGETNIWFRHFRRVEQVSYYGDFVTNAHGWERIIMLTTLSPLRSVDSQSRRLIDSWLEYLES